MISLARKLLSEIETDLMFNDLVPNAHTHTHTHIYVYSFLLRFLPNPFIQMNHINIST